MSHTLDRYGGSTNDIFVVLMASAFTSWANWVVCDLIC